ncbi:hypothetical protein GLX30_14675 [Streptomyces sp. Tu 2975]|uniref:hypothetical protein n=1 Tax=Streptomyces sp. Tu 2975 TaxID=2676871 RepID=UPI001356D498|nr:hypothetical protein [Streptomyces sp. Tu 2975]QIP85063.1 hypothetical protein GLX30_14675 [Streptomyces sp. Tu 2975]
MRKLTMALATLGLAAVGLAAPATAAPAAPAAPAGVGCDNAWPGSDGYVRAWDGYDCSSTYLGGTQGDDSNWADGSGSFTGSDNDRASSVMNSGYYGGEDVVAFYRHAGYAGGYNCLKRGELYVDSLSRNTYTTGYSMNNSISSHQWVYTSGCSRFMS